MRKQFIFITILSLCAALPCAAEYHCNNFTIILFGRVWEVDSYWVQEDLMKNPNEEVFLEPEGLAFQNSRLYVSGDREIDETDGRLAVYSYPTGGPLSYDGYVQMPNVEPSWWGPEGLTFNDSNDTNSYGGSQNQLVSVEGDDPCQAGIVDLISGDVSNRISLPKPEDISFVTGEEKFVVLSDMGSSTRVNYYDKSMTATGEFFDLVSGSSGLVAVEPNFGSWFTLTNKDNELFIVTRNEDSNNSILAYDLAGNQIGHEYNLPVEPKARIPLGGGFYLIEPAFGTVEAVTVDESNKVVFLGDEENCMVHILRPLRLAADLYTDGRVESKDLREFALRWLDSSCSDPDWCNGSDLDRNTKVDSVDYSSFAGQWGETENY